MWLAPSSALMSVTQPLPAVEIFSSYINQFGQTALHVASLWGNAETVKTLLDLGADVNIQNSRCT
jgi:ankyrin repeat protein